MKKILWMVKFYFFILHSDFCIHFFGSGNVSPALAGS
jgi:hypothetical protein